MDFLTATSTSRQKCLRTIYNFIAFHFTCRFVLWNFLHIYRRVWYILVLFAISFQVVALCRVLNWTNNNHKTFTYNDAAKAIDLVCHSNLVALFRMNGGGHLLNILRPVGKLNEFNNFFWLFDKWCLAIWEIPNSSSFGWSNSFNIATRSHVKWDSNYYDWKKSGCRWPSN